MQRLYLLFTHAELGGEPNQKVMMVLKMILAIMIIAMMIKITIKISKDLEV